MQFIIVSDVDYGNPPTQNKIKSEMYTQTDAQFVVFMGCLLIPPEPTTIKTCICKTTKSKAQQCSLSITSSASKLWCNQCLQERHLQKAEKVRNALSAFIENMVFPIEVANKKVFLVRGTNEIINDAQAITTSYMKRHFGEVYYYTNRFCGVLFIFLDNHPSANSRFWLSLLLQRKQTIISQEPIIIFFHYNLQQEFTEVWPLHEQEAFYRTIKGSNVIAIFTSSSYDTNLEFLPKLNSTNVNHEDDDDDVVKQYNWHEFNVYEVKKNSPIICEILQSGRHTDISFSLVG